MMTPFDLRQWEGFESAGGDSSLPALVDQIVLDSRRIASPNALFVALPGEHSDGHHFLAQAALAGARYALVDCGWNTPVTGLTLLKVKCPLTALQQIATQYRKTMKATVIGVTGSWGKTMLKDMLQALIGTHKRVMVSPESFNSQIGVALSLLSIHPDDEIAIIEAGVSKKGEMRRLSEMIAPHHCIITNIGPRHLDTLEDVATVAEEKMLLANAVPRGQWVLTPFQKAVGPLPVVETLDGRNDLARRYQVTFPDGNTFVGDITFGFTYMVDLVALAVNAAWLLEVPSHVIVRGLKEYVPESMRTEVWRAPTGVTFINSTYCADPQSIDVALMHLCEAPSHSRRVVIFGGLRGRAARDPTQLRRIGKAFRQAKISCLHLYSEGDYSALLAEIPEVMVQRHATVQEALDRAVRDALPNDTILLKGERKLPLDAAMFASYDAICHNFCVINLPAVQHNLSLIRSRLQKRPRVMVMVKALGYGTEDIRMSKFLATCGVDIVGVSYVEEGVALKRSGVRQSVFCLNATVGELKKAARWELEIGVGDATLIEALNDEAARQQKQIKVHLHVDTGMSRLGCRAEQAVKLAQLIQQCSHLQLEGVMTHLACADDPKEDGFTRQQIDKFDRVINLLRLEGIEARWTHAANSSTAIRFPDLPYNMVRVGLAVYGLHASATTQGDVDLRLAVSLTSHIVGINICKKGESVSYGRSYTIEQEEQRIAVIPIGYFDGLHRTYSGKGCVMVRGQAAPMVGNICMDYSMIDVTHIPGVSVGDPVLVFGEDEYGQTLPPEELALAGGSIAHELISCLGPRIQRVFIYE